MPLPTPILDDRSYQQLRDELVRRIPVYAPEWTDHNASDPGITLIELFAFLGENLLFRFNQIPETTKLAFLKLLQIPLQPGASSRALVALTGTDPAGVLAPLGSVASAGAISFETSSEALVWPCSFQAICKAQAAAPTPGEEQDFAAAALDAAQLGAGEQPVYYESQLVPVDPSKPGAEPINFETAVDGMIWIAVLDTTGVLDLDQMADHLLNVGFIDDQQVTGLADVASPCPGAGTQSTSPPVIWEASTGVLDPVSGQARYTALSVEGDTSAGLTQQGIVRLRLPRDATTLGTFTLIDPDLAGTRDLPPQIDDDSLAQKVRFWVRAFRPSGNKPFGRVRWIGANAVDVVQLRKARPEFLGTGTGESDQSYKLINRPVVGGSQVIEVEENGAFAPWTAVDGFESSSESDKTYVVDLEAGTVTFGNGVRGRAPQIGQRIRATEYRYGGGTAGNVQAGAINKLDDVPTLKVSNPLPAAGGADPEAIADALERVPGEVRRRDRAVTRDDFRELALATPGGDVGRAETMPLFHPVTRQMDPVTGQPDAAGVVSVVVWPREDRQNPNAPMPDRGLLGRVCAYLDARRLITTELWVIPPTYVKVAVAMGLKIKPGYGAEAVRRWVELVVRQYLAPLAPYGPEGDGWPLGRTVIGRELEAAALQVDGVQYLTADVGLARWDTSSGTWVAAPANTVALNPWEVPELAAITVVEGDPLQPGEAITPPQTGVVPVPIPILKDEC
jgi:predicted phage baseplate assembly protein